MKQKHELTLYTGTGFSTVEQSPLGQMLTILEKKLKTIIEQNKKNASQPTLERSYAVKQLQ